MGNKFDKIEIKWRNSEKGRVCFAMAVTENGEIINEEHVTIPFTVQTELYKRFAELSKEMVEGLVHELLKFKLDNPDLFE